MMRLAPWRQAAEPPPSSATAATPPPSTSPATPPFPSSPAPPTPPSSSAPPPSSMTPTTPPPPPPAPLPATPAAFSSSSSALTSALPPTPAAPPAPLAPPPQVSPAIPPSSASPSLQLPRRGLPAAGTKPVPPFAAAVPTLAPPSSSSAPTSIPPRPHPAAGTRHLPSFVAPVHTPTPPPSLPPSGTARFLHAAPPLLPPRPSPTLHDAPRPLGNTTITALPAGPSAAPRPCKAQPPQSDAEKSASLFGMLVPLILYTLPFFYQVYVGNIDKTTELFGTLATVAAFVNSILWLMYSTLINKSEINQGLLLLHAFCCMSSFCYLMSVYANRRAVRKGYVLGLSFLSSLSFIFAVLYWDLNPSEFMKNLFGWLGLGSLAVCHVIQMIDIMIHITKRSQAIASAVNLVPNFLVNLETMIITAQQHSAHDFILISSTIGFTFNMFEILIIIVTNVLPSTGDTDVDVEAAIQTNDVSNVPGGAATTDIGSEMAPRQDVAGVLGSDNIIARLTQGQRQQEATDVTIRCECLGLSHMLHPSSYTRVVLVQAVPREMLAIERDMYVPMLVQALGMAELRPHLLVVRNLELHYRLLLTRRLEEQRLIAGSNGRKMKRNQLTKESSANKKMKITQSPWRMQLPRPYASRRFRVAQRIDGGGCLRD